MDTAISAAMIELLKFSPYAAIIIFTIWITNWFHAKNIKLLQETFKETTEQIKEAYSDSLSQSREMLNLFRNKLDALTPYDKESLSK